MFKEVLNNVKTSCPLIHNITNYVTVRDVANSQLACGASPIMADDPEEVKEITALCKALNINIGTLNRSTIHSMIQAGQKAGQLHHAIVLDPVGAGASELRTETAMSLIRSLTISVIKGNMSEMKALARSYNDSHNYDKVSRDKSSHTYGVDVNRNDLVTEDNLKEAVEFAKWFGSESGSIAVITGPVDLVSDGKTCYVIRNGRPEMEKVTGCGCMLSGIIAAYYAANPDDSYNAVAAAVVLMGLAGEIAYGNMKNGDGNASYSQRIIDAIDNIDGDILDKGANFEIL